MSKLADHVDPRTGLYDWHHYMAEPWYVKPSLSEVGTPSRLHKGLWEWNCL